MNTSTTDIDMRWLFAALLLVALSVTVTLFSGLRGWSGAPGPRPARGARPSARRRVTGPAAAPSS